MPYSHPTPPCRRHSSSAPPRPEPAYAAEQCSRAARAAGGPRRRRGRGGGGLSREGTEPRGANQRVLFSGRLSDSQPEPLRAVVCVVVLLSGLAADGAAAEGADSGADQLIRGIRLKQRGARRAKAEPSARPGASQPLVRGRCGASYSVTVSRWGVRLFPRRHQAKGRCVCAAPPRRRVHSECACAVKAWAVGAQPRAAHDGGRPAGGVCSQCECVSCQFLSSVRPEGAP